MTKEKLDIGRCVYERKQTAKEVAEENGVTLQTVYLYAREYMKSIGVDPLPKGTKRPEPSADYRSMTKKELINELMPKTSRSPEQKKVCGEKGGGKAKEFISIKDASSR